MKGVMVCPESGLKYRLKDRKLICLDLDEDEDFPDELSIGTNLYDSFK